MTPTEAQKGEEMISIPRSEYDKLVETSVKVSLIEEVIHEPELSDDVKKEITEARNVPDSELIDHEEVKRRLGIK
ncbi:MAG: hypothetical protein KJ597_07195 [Nanoarchaeota archaeon]|nr:hypothetical protein [Nanoarchaeota archaeon]MBU1623330.1 hypothetical protein [Nanoarchaeota archaeon]